MASEISVKIKATSDAVPVIAGVEKETDALTAAVNDLKGSMETFSGKAKAAKDDLTKLDGSIRQNKQSLRDLATAFADASKESDKLDIAAKMSQVEKDLTRNLKARKIKLDELIDIDTQSSGMKLQLDKLLHVDGSDKAGRSIVKQLSQGIAGAGGELIGTAKQLGGPWGAAIAVEAAPALLSTLGGALSAGAGTVGIGTAIALAIKSDSGLQDAGKDLGKQLMGGLTQSAHTAFAEPIRATLKSLTGDVDQVTDQWGQAFEDLAPHLQPFIDSIAGTLTKLSGVFADIAGDSGPALEGLADGFETVGDSLGDLLTTLTQDAQGNADALETFLNVAAGAIDVINLLVQSYQDWSDTMGPVADLMNPIIGLMGDIGDLANASAAGVQTLKAANVETADAAGEAASQLEQERGALDGLAEALKAQTDPAYALIAAQKELADSQTAYSKAVKDHGKNSAQAKDALIDLSKASLDLESASEKAAGTFDGSVTPAFRATMKAAGLTDAQIDGVAKSFRDAKKAGDNFEGVYKGTIQERGAAAAKKAINEAAAAARAYEGQYIAALKVKITRMDAGFDGPQAGANKATGGITGSASGATSSGLTWVGEQGPELVNLPAGSRVWSNADSTRSNAQAGPSFGGRNAGNAHMPLIVKLVVDRRELGSVIVPSLQDFINDRAGGDINVLAQGFRS